MVLGMANTRQSMCVSSLAVHGLVLASRHAGFRRQVESFAILAADGQPVRWLMNCVCGFTLPERVCGTDLMDRVCAACASQGIGIYLYGSTAHVSARLHAKLCERYPALRIMGCEPSLFRPLSTEEDAVLVDRINASGAGVLFIGLGCPLQEQFAFVHRDRINAVAICCGAAFDFHAGEKGRAPRWMQDCGLEWLHRLLHEPRRLGMRYATTNAWFVWLVLRYHWRGILTGLRRRTRAG
jgi:N-acetylglucosaminyldiphosphoundecaprenol N-acetyl-beta-D-mannosaminyltransferase